MRFVLPELELGTVFEEGNNNHKRQLQEEDDLLEEEEGEDEEIEDRITGNNSRELKKVRCGTKK